MAGIGQVYQQLKKLDDPVVDRSLAAALDSADREFTKRIALVLLNRGHPDGLLALVMQFHRLAQPIQTMIMKRADDLDSALRKACSRRDGPGAGNAVAIIRRAGLARAAYLLVEQIRHGSDALRQASAEGLLELARSSATFSRPGVRPPCDAQTACFVQSATADALGSFAAHGRIEIIRALALLYPRKLAGVSETLADGRHPATRVAGQLIASSDEVELRRSMFSFATCPPLASAVLEAIEKALSSNDGEDLFDQWHLLHLPATVETISQLADMEPAWFDPGRINGWANHRSRGLALWFSVAPMLWEDRLAAFASLAQHPDPGTRFTGLRRLINLSESSHGVGRRLAGESEADAVNATIEKFCFDNEPRLSRLALRHLVRCKWGRLPQLLMQLVNVDHPEVRRFATDYLAPLGFQRFWSNWPGLDEAQRLTAGRALIKIDPGFHRHLAVKLKREDINDCLRALGVITTLNQGAFFELALLKLADHPDRKVASAAIKALGTVESETSSEKLQDAMAHRDSRVRANAVEALHQLNCDQHAEQLHAMVIHEDNRPRANAIGHLLDLDSDQAINALRFMLQDDRVAHRRSALWVVETAKLIEVARYVAEMAVSDPNVQMRGRAERLVAELIKTMGKNHPDQSDADESPDQAAEPAIVIKPLTPTMIGASANP